MAEVRSAVVLRLQLSEGKTGLWEVGIHVKFEMVVF
jgi:hypothetical protein